MVVLLLVVGLALAQEKPAPPKGASPEAKTEAVQTQPTRPPAQTPAVTAKKPTEEKTPSYQDLLNRQLEQGAPGAPPTPSIPPSTLYTPPQLPAAPTSPEVEKILGHYQPGPAWQGTYAGGKPAYALMQEQLNRKDLAETLGKSIAPISTNNPELYRQQLTQEVSRVLDQRTGVAGVPGVADLDTLLAVRNNLTPQRPLFPDPSQRYVPPTTPGTLSNSFTGSSPELNRLARINASLGSTPDLRRFYGLNQVDAHGRQRYDTFLSREYGFSNQATPYSVPRAYQAKLMDQQAEDLRQNYGLNVDPNSLTYSQLYMLRTSVNPR